MPTDIPELVLANPALTAALTIAVLAVVHWQRGLTYREYRAAHVIKCRVFGLLDGWARRRGRPLVRTSGDDDFVGAVDAPPRAVAGRIDPPFDPHLAATAKRRASDEVHPAAGVTRYQWAHSQWVVFHDDGRQTEVALFINPDGSTDVYAHLETSVRDPEGHLEDEQTHGDARGAFTKAYES